MIKRPLSVTIIGFVFIASGLIGLAYHLTDFNAQEPFQYEVIWVLLVRLIAAVCGVYMLRGRNWARWLALVWIGYHVILSSFHRLSEFVIHGLLFAVLAFFLLRPGATRYFRGPGTDAT